MAAKFGEAVKVREVKGLRLLPRGEGKDIIWYAEWRVADEKGIRQRLIRSMDTSDFITAKERAMAGPEAPAVSTFLSPKKATPALTLEKAFIEYETWFNEKHKASGAAVSLPPVEKFVDMTGSDLDTRAVTVKHVQAFVDSHDDHSPIYVRNQFARVRAFLRWIDRKHRDAVDLYAVKAVDLPEDDSVGREIPDMTTAKAALRKLSSHEWLGDYVTVLFETGMRPGELLAVRGVDLNGNILSIKPWGEWSPKSKSSLRDIQLNEAAVRILEARKKSLFDKRAPIFGMATGEMRTVKYVSKMYRKALGDSDQFKLCNLYVWKHLFCSFHAAAMVDDKPNPAFMQLQTLSAYIGHAAGSTRVLERWYTSAKAMRIGAPVALTVEQKDGKVIEMKRDVSG